MALTQQDIALQMIAQLRVLDPSASAEVGTPERKIIDTVAEAIAESAVDINLLDGSLDLDAKFGADLEKFLGIFGFGRQTGAKAAGYVTFSRTSALAYDIVIPRGTQVVAPSVTDAVETTSVIFETTFAVTLQAGTTSVVAPVQCLFVGSIGNVAANAITTFAGTFVTGITAVTNDVPTTGGVNPETDDELKIRFKNTVFRNLAGTQDQFLALAVSTQFTTKANVVGPISRYSEYIQVPDVDDTTADPDSGVSGNGNIGEYTSALSTIPYSKYIYDSIPYFVSNGGNGSGTIFYRQDTDFALNTLPADKDRGDTYRGRLTGSGPNVLTDPTTTFQPNLTFFSVLPISDDTSIGIRPQQIVLFEHSYLSSASRNDVPRNISNCVDVYINGENPTQASAAVVRPPSTTNVFSNNPGSRLYAENFRRIGEPHHRPVAGNLFTGLFWQPIIDLPQQITVGDTTYLNGVHYWAVEDVSEIGNTVRSRNGIEWFTSLAGMTASDDTSGPYTGPTITAASSSTINIDGYLYDKNIVDLQAAMEGSKQVTTDVLAHRATNRYFKLDITVMYSTGYNIPDVNLAVRDAVNNFFAGQYFGTTIQLSDLLQAIHNTVGVDNVRWSRETLTAQGRTVDTSGNARDRIVECDEFGDPLVSAVIDRVAAGPSTKEQYLMYFTGGPTGGTYQLGQGTAQTSPLAYNASATTIQSALNAASILVDPVTGSGTPADPFVITFTTAGWQTNQLALTTNLLTGGNAVFNSDFYLKDDELPALPTGALSTDSVPGLVIRSKAQNTWNQL